MKRTRTRLIGEVLEEFFKRPYVAAKIAEGKLPEYWREIVGEYAAMQTHEIRLENHILYIGITRPRRKARSFVSREFQIGGYRDIKHLTVGRLALKPPSAARRRQRLLLEEKLAFARERAND